MPGKLEKLISEARWLSQNSLSTSRMKHVSFVLKGGKIISKECNNFTHAEINSTKPFFNKMKRRKTPYRNQ